MPYISHLLQFVNWFLGAALMQASRRGLPWRAKRRVHGSEKRALKAHERATRRALAEMLAYTGSVPERELVVEERPDESHHILTVRRELETGVTTRSILHSAR